MPHSAPSPRTGQLIRFTITAGISVALFFVVATTSADVDLWGHTRFGLDILERGIDRTDPYSFSTDRPWINHEWLSEVTFGLAWSAAGSTGLIALKLAVIAGALWFAFQTLRLRGVGREAQLILLGFALAGMLPRLVHVRPQLFSVLLFSMLVWVFARTESGRRNTLALCPLLLMLWTNFHGGWITGLGALGLWAITDAWVRRREGLRALDGPAWTAASTVGTLLNPYGIGLWMFLLETVRPGREAIAEWGPIWTQPASLMIWLLFAAMVFVAIRTTGAAGLGSRLVQPLLWGLASLRVVRLDAFFVLSVIGFLGPEVERFLGRKKSVARAEVPTLVRAGIVAALLVVGIATPVARKSLSCISMYEQWWPEPTALEFIQANNLSGRMLTFFRWGEYAIWHLSPEVRISMDGRRETVYSEELVARHVRLYFQGDISLVDDLQPDYAWLPAPSPAIPALRERGWTAIFEGQQSVILARPELARRSFVRPEEERDPAPRCFPGP